MLRRLALLLLLLMLAGGATYWWVVVRPLPLPQHDFAFSVKPGASLRSVARELARDGVVPMDWTLVLLGRVSGVDRTIKAGSYEIAAGTTLAGLLRKLTQGDVTQSAFTIVEGWTFRDLKAALKANPNVVIKVSDLADAELMQKIGASETQPEGWFMPETYYFATGSTDTALLRRAYKLMRDRLSTAWNARASDLPLSSPYEALTLASIVEKETGRPADRPLVAAVFINRLRQGMRLQTDPTLIYGLGSDYTGALRRSDLDADHAFNTYTRSGLPPTPIAMPSQASLDAVLHPPPSTYLYFVARGDGSSEFSSNLSDHNRAVAKYQRGGR
jgi:peptidoglycan lytic transglycosylase G